MLTGFEDLVSFQAKPKKKAFFGWNVVLYCNRRRSIDIGRIISFGGGAAVLRYSCSVFAQNVSFTDVFRPLSSPVLSKNFFRNFIFQR